MSDTSEQADVSDVLDDLGDWRVVAMVVATGLVVYVMVTRFEIGRAFGHLYDSPRFAWVGLVVAGMVLNFGLAAGRFRTILRGADHRVGYGRSLAAILSAWPLGLLLPARTNDLTRAYFLRDRVPPWETAGAVVAERCIDLQTVLLFAAAGLGLVDRWAWSGAVLGVVAAGWGMAYLVLAAEEWVASWSFVAPYRSRLEALSGVVRALLERPLVGAAAVGQSVGVWLVSVGSVGLLCGMFEVGLGWREVLAVWPLASLVGMVPVTVGGIGTRDAAFASLATMLHPSTDEAAALSVTITYALVFVVGPSLVGLPFMVVNLGGD